MSDDLLARIAALEEALVCLAVTLECAPDAGQAPGRRFVAMIRAHEDAMIRATGGSEGDAHAHMRSLASRIGDALDTPDWPQAPMPSGGKGDA